MNPYKLRKSQQIAFEDLRGKGRCIANMPTGWGKSFLLCCLSIDDLNDPNRKVILCVPQRIIAKGFKKDFLIEMPDGAITRWKPPRNLCDQSLDKVSQLLHFIRAPASGSVEDRVVLTTHMSFSMAFAQLADAESDHVFRNKTIILDEAHHIHASELGRNHLGNAVDTLLNANDPTTRLILATAYFFRGDHLPIVDEHHLSRFYRHHVAFDEYWATLEHVKSYSYDFVAYKGTVFRELEVLLKKSVEATIIYCPPERHKMLLSKAKNELVQRIVALCEKHWNTPLWSSTVRPATGEKVIIDLVSTEFRSEKIKFIEEHGDQVAAILTVGMFREGADWKQASRILDLVPTGSDQDRLQRFGRLVRDYVGKSHVSYISFFPFVVEDSEEDRRYELSKLYAHFHASLVLANAIHPLKFKNGRDGRASSPESTGKNGGIDLLGQLSTTVQEAVIRESYDALGRIQTQQAQLGKSISPQMAGEAIVEVLKANGAATDLEMTAKQVLLVMRRKSNIALNADDLVVAGFDRVWSTDIFDGLVAYSAKFGGPDTLAEIRRIIEGVFEQQWMSNFNKVSALPQQPNSQTTAYHWCTHNRVLHQTGALTAEKQRLLENIKWWRWAERFEDRWQCRFDEVRLLPACPKAGTTEYNWVRQQRRMHQEGKLETFKMPLLESIKWWSWASNDRNWQVAFGRVESKSEPPVRGTADYEWVRTQRKRFHSGKLSEERKAQLESVGWWEWGEAARSRDEGLDCLSRLIDEGVAQGRSKAEVQADWGAQLKIGADQIHKYRRLLPMSQQEKWKQLIDARRMDSGTHPR